MWHLYKYDYKYNYYSLPVRAVCPSSHHQAALQVRSHFRPEFINRIDEFTVFNPLNRADIKRIVRLQAKRVEERLTAKKMKMQLLEPAIEFLAVWHCSIIVILHVVWASPRASEPNLVSQIAA